MLPLLVAWFAPLTQLITLVALASLVFLALLGSIAAVTGGAPIGRACARVTFWGAMAMLLTAVVGHWFGVTV
jgi:VIT1/CCC1 family predicted Fe2+/Mn2+ transporter